MKLVGRFSSYCSNNFWWRRRRRWWWEEEVGEGGKHVLTTLVH